MVQRMLASLHEPGLGGEEFPPLLQSRQDMSVQGGQLTGMWAKGILRDGGPFSSSSRDTVLGLPKGLRGPVLGLIDGAS